MNDTTKTDKAAEVVPQIFRFVDGKLYGDRCMACGSALGPGLQSVIAQANRVPSLLAEVAELREAINKLPELLMCSGSGWGCISPFPKCFCRGCQAARIVESALNRKGGAS